VNRRLDSLCGGESLARVEFGSLGHCVKGHCFFVFLGQFLSGLSWVNFSAGEDVLLGV
jgi:hypothetical protein